MPQISETPGSILGTILCQFRAELWFQKKKKKINQLIKNMMPGQDSITDTIYMRPERKLKELETPKSDCQGAQQEIPGMSWTGHPGREKGAGKA